MSVDPLRRQIVVEATRLVIGHVQNDYGKAIRHAARRVCAGRVPRGRLPTPRELHSELQRAEYDRDAGREPDPIRIDPVWIKDESSKSEELFDRDRFCVYQALLRPLEQVWLNPRTHPEGDALYHSLQVYALARESAPFDEELQLAALLHEVGRAIDPRDPILAGLDALDDTVTERTAWLIEHHDDAHRFREQTLGSRARRRFLAHPDFESLELLVDCDRRGRMVGMRVPDVDEALDEIRELSRS